MLPVRHTYANDRRRHEASTDQRSVTSRGGVIRKGEGGVTKKLNLAAASLMALGLSACHFSNSEYGPASAGAAPIANSNGAPTTLAKVSGPPAVPGSHPTTYDGAGFPIPDYPTTTLPGWQYGLPQSPATLSQRVTKYGDILTTAGGRTLYIRIGDQFRKSECYSICTAAFPPFLTNGAPMAKGGILAADIGVLVSNVNKGEQLSYGGHPLYTYSGDTKPGDINAEGKGKIWYVISVNALPVFSVPVGAGGLQNVG